MFCRCSGKSLPPKDFPSVAIGTVPMFMVERQRRGGGSPNFDWVAWVTELTVFFVSIVH